MQEGGAKLKVIFVCRRALELMVLEYLDVSDGLEPPELRIHPGSDKVLKLPLYK